MSGPTRARWPPSDDRVAAGLAASALFLVAWGLVQTWFWAHGAIVDWPSYQDYGAAIRAHYVPYRDFRVEYPPGALPVFVLPSVLGGDYAGTFAWTMAVCGVVLVWIVTAVNPRAALYVALAPLLSGSLIVSRFDLWPTLLATGALVGCSAGGTGSAGRSSALPLRRNSGRPCSFPLRSSGRRVTGERELRGTALRCWRSRSCRS